MRKNGFRGLAVVLLVALLSGAALTACADIAPYGYTRPDYILAKTTNRLALNSGPGTKKYFKELGTYGSAGEYAKILAKAWDPNNGIWWLKVEYPVGSGFVGWTGEKRFDASTFNRDDVPTEYWYPY